jgi:large subunit ribosomal protein L25
LTPAAFSGNNGALLFWSQEEVHLLLENTMSALRFELEAKTRLDQGKGASRRLRHTDKVPAVIYGAGQPAVALVLEHKKVVHALANEAFYSHILTLQIDGKAEKVILKDLQRHSAKPRILHMDFLRIRADQKLHMHIPLHFVGDEDAPGVKEGGIFSHNLSDVEVSCLPANLPEFIEVDTSHLELDGTIHLSQIKLPKGVELVAFSHGIEGHDLPVVSLHRPRVEVEEEAPESEISAEAADASAAPVADAAASAKAPAAKKDAKK